MSKPNDNGNTIVTTSPDPTINVQNLLKEAVKRIDDLRQAEIMRVDQKIDSESERAREIMALRAEHGQQLMLAEAKRIDAIRVVDVNSVSIANEKATAQAVVLANQVATSAETLRNLVATTAATTATQLDQLTKQLTDRLALLEKAQYEGAGKQTVTDPRLADLFTEMKTTRTSLSEGTGRSSGMSASWALLLGAVGLISAILAIGSRFIK